MNIAQIKPLDIANGPGVRVSVFVSGCTRKCEGCFNAVAWDFNYGEKYTQNTEEDIMRYLSHPNVAGLTILGGEPFELKNQHTVCSLIEDVSRRYPTKTIWVFTGYTIEELTSNEQCNENIRSILNNIDVLVDGPFILAKKNLMLKYRGSENQRLIDVAETLEHKKVILWKDCYDAI